MQEQAVQPPLPPCPDRFLTGVAVIARQRMAHVFRMGPDLVSPAGQQLGFGVAAAAKGLQQCKSRQRWLALLIYFDLCLPSTLFLSNGASTSVTTSGKTPFIRQRYRLSTSPALNSAEM